MNISGPAAVAKPEMLFYAPGDLTVTFILIMKQHFTDERTGISYTLQGDYYLPDLALPAEEQVEVGIWGQRHLQYIKAHRKGFYTTLLTKCELNRHLADVNTQAEDMYLCPL